MADLLDAEDASGCDGAGTCLEGGFAEDVEGVKAGVQRCGNIAVADSCIPRPRGYAAARA